jgi:CheY-like chemotaxis protein
MSENSGVLVVEDVSAPVGLRSHDRPTSLDDATLFAREPATWPFRPRRAREPVARTETPWILVVDDEYLIRLMLQDVLSLAGYAVETADNGATALELLEPDPPGLVVLDMRMPAMNGWEFAETMRARGLTIPILAIAAAENAPRWAREIGAADWLGKPFRLPDLVGRVDRLLPRAWDVPPPMPGEDSPAPEWPQG